MASLPRPQRTNTQRDYLALNYGYEDNVPDEDQYSDFPSQATPFSDSFEAIQNDQTDLSFDQILPSESASQTIRTDPDTSSYLSAVSLPSIQKRPRKTIAESQWLWGHFDIELINRPWMTRAKKAKAKDRLINCKECNWETSDSARSGSTKNMQLHLENQHAIKAPLSLSSDSTRQPSIIAALNKKPKLSTIAQFQENILRWIVKEKMAFTTIEAPSFHQIFVDLSIPELDIALFSRTTLKRKLEAEFRRQREILKIELASTCRSIALSLDIWTSSNHISIIGIIGHWLTPDFIYKERVLEFKELRGTHSGENIAQAVFGMLQELNLQQKLLTITGDNASNNEAMVIFLHDLLKTQCQEPQFLGLDSYIRCLAHILNLIVKDILRALKSGTIHEASEICNHLDNQDLSTESALSRIRILAIWISRSNQRRASWRSVCALMKLPDRYIPCDIDTRWNSTFLMLDTALESQPQINRYLELQTELPHFTKQDWRRLSQIHQVLKRFYNLTLFVSRKYPQISMAIPIYYELHDLLNQGAERQGVFADIDDDIAGAIYRGLVKYEKYYTFMDETDAYYTALILDPRMKGDLLLHEVSGHGAGQIIIDTIRDNIRQRYHHKPIEEDSIPSIDPILLQDHDDPEVRMLQRLAPIAKKVVGSDIDEYFTSPRIDIKPSGDREWLVKWWGGSS
ncbi:hypothetical protein N7481_008478 [Penicillium waksmanii]|uniref:uncharacterized protein n=1 Tax=Penicillium waksmanii TaxID=69791 RepID=UPI002547733C|nr:uncharacterized protein N7481_008478 [Penicillium waksmanii]KAJ5974771.1 hypothetical protein N7481_008478 [Penicillium waksmanii]